MLAAEFRFFVGIETDSIKILFATWFSVLPIVFIELVEDEIFSFSI